MVKSYDPDEIAWAMQVAANQEHYGDKDVLSARRKLRKWSKEITKRERHLSREINWRLDCARINYGVRCLVESGG